MKRAKNKGEELKQRSEYDEKKEEKVKDGYEKLLEEACKAAANSLDPFYISSFKNRCKERDRELKSMVDFLKIKPYELQQKSELKEFNSFYTKLKNAIDAVDEYTKDLRAAVENLQTYIRDYPDMPLFQSNICKTADFNLKTGEVSIVLLVKRI